MSIEVCLRKFTESEILGLGEMKSIKKDVVSALQQQLGKKPEWKEGKSEDEDSLPLGGWTALAQLQRYAAHIDLADKPPEKPEEDVDAFEEDEHLLQYWESAENELSNNHLRFRHLIWVGSIGVFYIPVDFPEPILIKEEREEEEEEENEEGIEYISIGSSYQLLKELNEINQWLNLQGDYKELGNLVTKDIFENEADQWREIKWAWLVLQWMAKQSIKKQLTICFE